MIRALTLILAAATLTGCAAYEPEPVSPYQWQQRQERIDFLPPGGTIAGTAIGVADALTVADARAGRFAGSEIPASASTSQRIHPSRA